MAEKLKMDLRLDHIGIVVKDIEKASQDYQRIHGLKRKSKIIQEPAHNVEVMFFETGHGAMPMIELIMPLSDSSKVSGFLKKTGGGIHHVAYEVKNIDNAIEHYKSLGSIILGDIVPGAGHSNLPTIWIYTPDKTLIELIEQGHHER
jgi:methylmalonyl-CoA/ethylmalonyl-CoA epimerase